MGVSTCPRAVRSRWPERAQETPGWGALPDGHRTSHTPPALGQLLPHWTAYTLSWSGFRPLGNTGSQHCWDLNGLFLLASGQKMSTEPRGAPEPRAKGPRSWSTSAPPPAAHLPQGLIALPCPALHYPSPCHPGGVTAYVMCQFG